MALRMEPGSTSGTGLGGAGVRPWATEAIATITKQNPQTLNPARKILETFITRNPFFKKDLPMGSAKFNKAGHFSSVNQSPRDHEPPLSHNLTKSPRDRNCEPR